MDPPQPAFPAILVHSDGSMGLLLSIDYWSGDVDQWYWVEESDCLIDAHGLKFEQTEQWVDGRPSAIPGWRHTGELTYSGLVSLAAASPDPKWNPAALARHSSLPSLLKCLHKRLVHENDAAPLHGMKSNPFFHIRSTKLRVLPGEEAEFVNEGTYGKALALYLREALAPRAYAAGPPVCEDWGWWLTIEGLPFPCGLCLYASRIEGTEELDLCATVSTPKGRKWSWKRFRFIDTTAEVEKLHHALRAIFLEDPDITLLAETEDYPLA